MRIGIDVRYLSHGITGGVHTYIANLLPAMLAQCEGHELLLYADTKRPFELASLPPWAQHVDDSLIVDRRTQAKNQGYRPTPVMWLADGQIDW